MDGEMGEGGAAPTLNPKPETIRFLEQNVQKSILTDFAIFGQNIFLRYKHTFVPRINVDFGENQRK